MMETRIRRKILTLCEAEYMRRPYWREVRLGPPPVPFPNTMRLPALALALATTTTQLETNLQAQNFLGLWVVGIFAGMGREAELRKADVIDEMEAALRTVNKSAEFKAIAALLHIDHVDPSPISLIPFGVDGTLPLDENAVRMDCRIDFHYDM